MLEKLNYTKKSWMLLGGFVLFLLLGYQFSFKDTFTVLNEIKEKEQKLTWLKDKEKELPALKTKMHEFEKAYAKTDSIAVRDKLTAYISDYSDQHQCIVTEIPTNSFFKNDHLNVQTNTFTIKGEFKNLVTLVHQLEKDFNYLAKLMSVKFFSIKDMQTKRKTLYVTIITQSFEQKLNNEKNSHP